MPNTWIFAGGLGIEDKYQAIAIAAPPSPISKTSFCESKKSFGKKSFIASPADIGSLANPLTFPFFIFTHETSPQVLAKSSNS